MTSPSTKSGASRDRPISTAGSRDIRSINGIAGHREIDSEAQPLTESGVISDGFAGSKADPGITDEDGTGDDMATLAVNPISGTFGADPRNSEATRSAGNFAGMEDADIMLQLSAGDMAAFDFLLAKYRRPIIHFMYRMVHNEAIAEELAQEVFLRVYRSRETYRAEARFSTWLYRIATNLGVNHARDTRHERAASTVYLDEPDGESGSTPDVADLTPGAEANILRRERMAAIREHVTSLPERQRMAVLMHKYEGLDYKQIGEVMKLSESATKSLLFRAYQTLREKLKPFI
jgi:RNA polymerase sigma-70 factor (ECF subfamily)